MTEPLNIKPDAVLDMGKKACGELVINLMRKARTLKEGQILEVHALDSGASEDIPSWCRMTQNELLAGPCGEGNVFYYIKIAPRNVKK